MTIELGYGTLAIVYVIGSYIANSFAIRVVAKRYPEAFENGGALTTFVLSPATLILLGVVALGTSDSAKKFDYWLTGRKHS